MRWKERRRKESSAFSRRTVSIFTTVASQLTRFGSGVSRFSFHPMKPIDTKSIDLVRMMHVLISHGLRSGFWSVKQHQFGCSDLLQAVTRSRPAYHLFDIHDAYGIEKLQTTPFPMRQ